MSGSGEPTDEVGRALQSAVSEYGARSLSSPQVLGNLLSDLLPDAPREASLLLQAAEVDVAGTLARHVASNMDPETAVRITASSLGESRPLSPEACLWVTTEFARALGYPVTPPAGPMPGAGPATAPAPGGPPAWGPPGGGVGAAETVNQPGPAAWPAGSPTPPGQDTGAWTAPAPNPPPPVPGGWTGQPTSPPPPSGPWAAPTPPPAGGWGSGQPTATAPPYGGWAPGGPGGPGAPLPPPGGGGKKSAGPKVAIAAGGVLAIIIVYVIVAAAAKLPPFGSSTSTTVAVTTTTVPDTTTSTPDTTPSSSATAAGTTAFLSAIHTQTHFDGLSDSALTTLGDDVCKDFDNGLSLSAVESDALKGVDEINANDEESGNNPGGYLDAHDAGFLIGASVKGLCPQYSSQIPSG